LEATKRLPVVASGAGRHHLTAPTSPCTNRLAAEAARPGSVASSPGVHSLFRLHAGKPDDLRPLVDIADIISIDLIDFEPKEFPSPASA